jgi:WD40 repeat protein
MTDSRGIVTLWEAESGMGVWTALVNSDCSVAFDSETRLLAYGEPRSRGGGLAGVVVLRDVETGEVVKVLEGAPVTCKGVAFSPDGRFLACCGGEVVVWEVSSGLEVWRLEGEMMSVAFHPEGKILAAGGREIKLLDVDGGGTIRSLPGRGGCISFSPDGKVLCAASGGGVGMWGVKEGRLMWEVQESLGAGYVPIAFHPDGKKVVVGGAFTEDGGGRSVPAVYGYDVETGEEVERREWDRGPDYTGWVTGIGFDSKGERMAVGSVELRRPGEEKPEWNKDDPRQQVGALRCVEFPSAAVSWETPAEPLGAMVHRVAVHPDGNRFASISGGEIRLWDVETGKVERSAEVRLAGNVGALAIAPDGSTLALAEEGGIRLVDATSGKERGRLKEAGGTVRTLAFHPKGDRLASADGEGRVHLWDLGKQGEDPILLGRGWTVVGRIVFSPEGKWLAISGARYVDRVQTGKVEVYEVATGRVVHASNAGALYLGAVAFSPDGRYLAGTGAQGESNVFKVWRTEDWKEASVFGEVQGYPVLMSFHPGGKMLATNGGNREILLWDVERGECVKVLSVGIPSPLGALAFASQGDRLAIGGYRREEGRGIVLVAGAGTVEVWDTQEEKKVWEYTGLAPMVTALAFDTKGEAIVALAGSQAVLLDVNGKESRRFSSEPVEVWKREGQGGSWWSLVYAPDGKTLACAMEGEVILFESETLKERGRWSGTFADRVGALAYDRNGDRLAVAFEAGGIEIRDAGSMEVRVSWKGETLVYGAAFSLDGEKLYTWGYGDGFVRVWDPDSGEEIKQWKGDMTRVWALAQDAGGTFLATAGSDRSVKIWDVATGELRHTCLGQDRPITTVAVSPDGRRIASGGWGSEIYLWDAVTGKYVDVLQGHVDSIHSLQFTSDGKRLISGSADTTIRIWPVGE